MTKECLEFENWPRRTRFTPTLALVAVLVQSATVHAEPSGQHLLSGEWEGKFRFMGNKRNASLILLGGEHTSITLTLDLEPSTENYKVTSQKLPKIKEGATRFSLSLSNELFENITCDFKILNANKLEGSCGGFDAKRLVEIQLKRLENPKTTIDSETSDVAADAPALESVPSGQIDPDTPDKSADKNMEQESTDAQ